MPFFPPTGGGSLAPAGLPPYQVFAAPGGSDNSDGSQGSPVATLYKATQLVIAHGGGTVLFTDGTTVGGPVTDQGLWLRNDGVAVPGFLNLNDAPIVFVGNGNSSGQFAFERPGAARFVGGASSDFRLPGLWVVGSEVPVSFSNMKNFVPESNGIAAPVRLGWDYARKPDFSLEEITVTNATRTAGSTVLTVDVASATAWAITHADRDGDDNVTLTLTRPLTVALSPWVPGSVIRVNTGGDTDFPNVDATVTSQSDVLNQQGETTITVVYVQSGATIAKSLSGTVKAHGCRVGDLVSVLSNDSEFVTCSQQRVLAATVSTITINDPYGYAPRSASANQNNIGTVVKQVRGRSVASGVGFSLCSFFGKADSADNFFACAAMDMGGTSVNLTVLSQVYISGANRGWALGTNTYDPERTQVAIFASPGGGTLSGASLQYSGCQSQSGHVVWDPQQTEAKLLGNQWLQDSANESLPTIVCEDGSSFASVFLDETANADSNAAAIEIGTGYDSLKCIIGAVFSSNPIPVVNRSTITGPTNMRSAFWTDQTTTPSPWELGWLTKWPGGLTTPHVNVNRAMGPVQARFANLFPQFGSYVGGAGQPVSLPTGITITNASPAPDGSSTALKVSADNTYNGTAIVIGKYPETLSASVGDYVAIGCWVKAADPVSISMSSYTPGDIVFTSGGGLLATSKRIARDGWQWCVTYSSISAYANGHYFLSFSIPTAVGDYYFFAPTLIYAPSSVGAQDFYEAAGTLKHQPVYLPTGTSGTMENTKFCADGGLMTNSANAKSVGAGSGQLTLTGTGTVYLPEYDRDGTTIIGWKAMLQATVNP